MMDWKDEIRKTIYRQLPQEGEAVYEEAADPKKLNTGNEPSIWEKTAMAVREELLREADEDTVHEDIMQKELLRDDIPDAGAASDEIQKAPEQEERSAVKEQPKPRPKKEPSSALDQETRQWLFKENLRLEGLRSELSKASKMMQKQADQLREDSLKLEEDKKLFEQEKEEFKEEMKDWNEQIRQSKKKLENDQLLFDKKYKVLEMGFAKLNEDRKQLEAQKRAFEYKKKFASDAEGFSGITEEDTVFGNQMQQDYIFFKGVTHPVAVKKRYKELIKIYHPDNSDGDKYILQLINKEYDRIRRFQG